MNIDAKCKKCRRNGQKLFLKGDRCFTPKCAMVKRPFPPGLHGKKRKRGSASEYGRQLTEKQKIRNIYCILEKQFNNYVVSAMKEKGDKRENLIKKLETRLDNIVFRLGFAKSRYAAKQIVSHGHIAVNGKKVDISSYKVKIGDVVSIKEKSLKSPLFDNLKIAIKKYQAPSWIALDKEKLEGKIVAQPVVSEFDNLSGIGMVIEYYSR